MKAVDDEGKELFPFLCYRHMCWLQCVIPRVGGVLLLENSDNLFKWKWGSELYLTTACRWTTKENSVYWWYRGAHKRSSTSEERVEGQSCLCTTLYRVYLSINIYSIRAADIVPILPCFVIAKVLLEREFGINYPRARRGVSAAETWAVWVTTAS